MLKVDSISSVRDDRVLFQALSLQLAAGQLLVVEGRNGSGKTTLLRMLCGFRLPDEGEILWQETPIDRLKGQYYQQLAYIGHHNGIKLELTPVENLEVEAALNLTRGMDVDRALAQVGLAGFEDVPAVQLSAGQRKRVALARLLIGAAPLWILDEAFTALDRDGVKCLEAMIAQHLEQQGMVVMTSHQDIQLPAGRLQKVSLS